mgnify:FL=1|jgi:putative flippase GtrA
MIGSGHPVGRFLWVGGGSTLAHYLLMSALVEWGDWAPVPAAVAGFLLGAVVNYVLNRAFTFRSGRPHRIGVPRFAVMLAVGCGVNAMLVALWVHGLRWHYLVSQAAATLVVMVMNYLVMRHWVFGEVRAHG